MLLIRLLAGFTVVTLLTVAAQLAALPRTELEQALGTAIPLALACFFVILTIRQHVLGLPAGRWIAYGLVVALFWLAAAWVEVSRARFVFY